MPIPVIDTHIHIWDLKKATYTWLEGDTSLLNRTYCLDELAEERLTTGITGGVLVQAANNKEDTALMLDAADNSDWITGVVGWLPLQDPDATEKALTKNYLNNGYFKGCRHLIHNEADPYWLSRPNVIESLKIIAGYRLTYDVVGIHSDHLLTAIKVAEKVPHLKMVLDHLNQPPVSSRQRFGRWGELLKEAAQHKNMFAKISGLGSTAANGKEWMEEDIKPYIMYAIDSFGAERSFCGGDWPVSLLAGTYGKTWDAYKNILAEELTEKERENILYHNACRFYNITIIGDQKVKIKI